MIRIYKDLAQGSEEWHAARCGMLTASEMHLVYQPPKIETRVKKNGEPYKQREASLVGNEQCRAHLYELLSQRITQYAEPTYCGYSMMRGHDDEQEALRIYEKHVARVERVGFITNDNLGFTIGYSPDALVGDDGAVECKSKIQKLQIRAILSGDVPNEHIVQIQTGLFVSGRKWCDFISYCGGLPMMVVRAYADPELQEAITDAATAFERALQDRLAAYKSKLASGAILIPTERRAEQEMFT